MSGRGAKTIEVLTGFTFVSRVILIINKINPKINNKYFKFSILIDLFIMTGDSIKKLFLSIYPLH